MGKPKPVSAIICHHPKESMCPDCATPIGKPHKNGCDVERCTVCKGQRLGCTCKKHNKKKAAWTGYWPGELECFERGWTLHAGATPGIPEGFPDLNRWAVFQGTGKDPGPSYAKSTNERKDEA